MITREQIMDRLDRRLDREYGTPAGDRLVFVEVGAREEYEKSHIAHALYLSEEQLRAGTHLLLPNKGHEIIIYGRDWRDPLPMAAAERLAELGYANLHLYQGGKADWIAGDGWVDSTLVPADGIPGASGKPSAA